MGLTVTQVLVIKRSFNIDTHQRQGHAGDQGSVQCCVKARDPLSPAKECLLRGTKRDPFSGELHGQCHLASTSILDQ